MTIRIWLGDLGAYNAGTLRGEWLNLPMCDEDLAAKVSEYTNNGQGDYFIADSECDVEGVSIKEYTDPFRLNYLAEQLDRLNDHDQARVAYLLSDGADIDDALDSYEDVDFYPGMNLAKLAEHFVDEGLFGEIASTIINYIDYEAIGRGVGCASRLISSRRICRLVPCCAS
jgi:hypothetical protein